jgi:hypothetical protein
MQGMFFGFVAAWWQLRHEPNVLLLHYADIKRGGGKVLRRISDFLGTKPTEAQWATIEKHASFEWMKTNQSKFETFPHAVVPVLESGAMIRKGQTGAAHEDGMTSEIAGQLRAFGSKIVGDPVALAWLYEGGPLPA